MTREELIRMAREQGLPETEVEGVFMVNTDDLGRFAELVRADERDDILRMSGNQWFKSQLRYDEAIRARGQA
jgi:hypothetical protein